MTGWLAALAELSAAGRAAVVVTVLRAEGSTPREAGAKMVVTSDGARGTIGGGHLEWKALELARELLRTAVDADAAPPPVVREFALGPSLGQCCGGAATLLFEPLLPVRWDVAIFGAGHVGKATVKVLAELPCNVIWIDPREAEFPQAAPPGVRIVADDPVDAVADLRPGSDAVVMMHSHELDFRVAEAALRRRDLGYVGVIGSATKRARFLARLAERGFGAEDLARLTCPVGLPGIRGKHPAVIAIAVAAQLLQRRK
jgi:xanthine dehydrogenase accessory factor